MFIETIKTPGLAHLSYIVGNGDECAVIDPRRDIDDYIQIAKSRGCKIAYVFETHRNEDLISGASALAQLTGAEVFHGPNPDGEVTYAKTVVEGDKFKFGDLTLEVLETPGHTKDSISILVSDQEFSDQPVAVFTGDTVFVGDVGRTDFYPEIKEEIAGMLFDSLKKITARASAAIIYPAHGAGSVCGDGMADREFSTVKYESSNNPMMKIMDRQQFIERKVAEHHYYAPYFERMEKLNMSGSVAYDEPRIVTPINYTEIKDKSYTMIDVRSVESYLGAHYPNSLSLPVEMITSYAGWLLSHDEKLIIIADNEAMASEAALHFARIGYDKTHCFINANFAADAAQGEKVVTSQVADAMLVKQLIEREDWQLLDVRKITEREKIYIEDSKHIFLGHLGNKLDKFDSDQKVITMCASGVRATIAASLLQLNGMKNVKVFMGSMGAWKSAGYAVKKP